MFYHENWFYHNLTISKFKLFFLKHFSFQCGYCTPGFLLGASLLIDQLQIKPIKQDQLDQLILENVGDHICRCTGYARYYSAIKEVILKIPGLTFS